MGQTGAILLEGQFCLLLFLAMEKSNFQLMCLHFLSYFIQFTHILVIKEKKKFTMVLSEKKSMEAHRRQHHFISNIITSSQKITISELPVV